MGTIPYFLIALAFAMTYPVVYHFGRYRGWLAGFEEGEKIWKRHSAEVEKIWKDAYINELSKGAV